MKRFQATFTADGIKVSAGGTWEEIWANVQELFLLGFQIKSLTIKFEEDEL